MSLRRRTLRRRALLAALPLLAACPEPIDVDATWSTALLPAPDAPVDDRMANAGAEIFRRQCSACHGIGEGVVIGPDLHGVTERRDMRWIRGMIAEPDSMLRVDSIARALLVEYTVPMLDRELDDARVRAVIEFLRRADHPPAGTQETPAPSVP